MVCITFPLIITKTIIAGAVVSKVAAPTVPARATTPAPPAIVCKARGSVFIALRLIKIRGEK